MLLLINFGELSICLWRAVPISFWSRCDNAIRPRGFTNKTPTREMFCILERMYSRVEKKTCGCARLTWVKRVWVFCTIHLFCILHSSTDLHKNTKHLTSGVSLSKPTRADYSVTTGSQTAGHNPTHVYIPKWPKSFLHSKNKSIALLVALLYSTHGIQLYQDHSRLIALTMRTNKKK